MFRLPHILSLAAADQGAREGGRFEMEWGETEHRHFMGYPAACLERLGPLAAYSAGVLSQETAPRDDLRAMLMPATLA